MDEMENPACLTPSGNAIHGQGLPWASVSRVDGPESRERKDRGGVSGSGEGEAPPWGLGFFESLLGRGAAAGPPAYSDQLIPGPSLFSLNS